MDRMSPEHYRDVGPEQAVIDSRESGDFVTRLDPSGNMVRPVITPRFAPSCTPEALAGLGALANETQWAVQTHISENHGENALVKELFPAAKSYAAVYDEAGLLGKKTILAHAVHLTEEEVALVVERGTHVSHCPLSNTSLTSGAAPVRDMLDAGVSVSLGTDMSGGYSPSILEMVRQALGVSRHVAMLKGDRHKLCIEEALWLATRGGAEAVGLGTKVGSFEVGKEWDAQCIVLDEVDENDVDELMNAPVDLYQWQRESWEDIVAKWVYTGDDRNVAAVWVKGRLVHKMKSLEG
jgi:guanine deaminase